MRPIITNEMQRAQDIIMPHMQYTKEKGWDLKPDTPEEIRELRQTLQELLAELRRDAM